MVQGALFNQTEIAFILMDHGANAERKNAQGSWHVFIFFIVSLNYHCSVDIASSVSSARSVIYLLCCFCYILELEKKPTNFRKD